MAPLPDPLLHGLAIAGALAAVFAVVFAAGARFFPAAPVDVGDRRSGEWKRRREIRAYLDRIGERYHEDRDVAGQRVAFYLPERGVAITFDARAYFRLESDGVTPVLAEHEMPGAHLGARLPFETPPAPAAGAPVAPAENAFAVLGLSPDATTEEVTAAYRERVKDAHPDHGGDEAAFRRVREAYVAARQAAD